MKKIIALFLCLIMISVTSSCCINIPKSDEVADKVSGCLTSFLQVKEEIISGAEWVCSYINEFCASPDFAGYNRCICAVYSYVGALKNVAENIPAYTIEDEDYEELLNRGIDISFLEAEFVQLGETVNAAIAEWENIGMAFFSDAYWDYGMEWIAETGVYHQEYCYLDAMYYRLMTNYILCDTGEKDFSHEMKNLTSIFPENSDFLRDKAEIEALTDECLDKTEQLGSKRARLEALAKANYDILEKAFNSGDYGEFFERAALWGSTGIPFPSPGGEISDVICFYSDGDDAAEISYIVPGDELEKLNFQYYVVYKNTEKEQFCEYINIIKSYGSEVTVESGTAGGDGDYSLCIGSGDALCNITWSNGEVLCRPDESCILCPAWYFAYRAQEAQK